jgi:hypothetical protein
VRRRRGGRQDLANDGSLDNGPSGTLRNQRTKRFLIFSARSSARALIARFGVTHPSPRARTHATARAQAFPTIAFSSAAKRMTFREPEVVRASFIHERKCARRSRARRGTPKSCSASLERSFERFSQRIAFRELSNSPPLTRSCQEGSDAISLNSASYAGPAIAFCDGSRIHGDADRGDLDCAEKNEMSSHLLYGALSE